MLHTCAIIRGMDYFDYKKRDSFKGAQAVTLPTEAFSDYVEHPLIRRMYLTDIGFFPRAEKHYKERKEGIEEYIFLYCTDGEGIIRMAGKEYRLQEHEALCIPQFMEHVYFASPENPWSILWVHFKGEDTVLYPLAECRIIHFESEYATGRMMFLFDLLFRVLDANYTEGNFVYISQVLSMILSETYFREKQGDALEQNKLVTHVIRYFYQHLEENLSLDQVASQFDLSKSYLNVIFQKHTRHAPMDFYIHLKMKRACNLLRSTDLYIYEVAGRLGYDDQYYFSRIFKKVIGVSPKIYRDSDYIDVAE